MTPLVSILIPAYNAQDSLADTIRSAIAQTWPRKEIIIVDDGSRDRTLEIARRFSSPSTVVVTQHNQGAAAARNNALSLSNGDYIQWLDADDLLHPDKVRKQMELLASGVSNRTLLSSSWGSFLYRPHRARFTPTALWRDLSPLDFLLLKLGRKVFMQTATWLVSRQLTQAAGPWDASLLSDDDGEYFCRVLLASDYIKFARDAHVYYRSVGSGSLSYVGRSNLKLEALWRSMQLHMRYIRSLEDSERVRAACVTYLQHYMLDFYPFRLDLVERMQDTARHLGGQLRTPQLPWKYAWIKSVCGWTVARHAQWFCPALKWSILRTIDKLVFRIMHSGLTMDSDSLGPTGSR